MPSPSMKGYALRAKRAERSDIIWGIVLGVSIPVFAIIIFKAGDFMGTGDETYKTERFIGKDELYSEVPPMNVAHAQAVIKQIERLHHDNYSTVFLPRMNATGNAPDNMRIFGGLKDVYEKCSELLEQLKKQLMMENSQITSLRPQIEALAQTVSRMKAEVERLNPRPEGM